jgi:hypothetical protein
MSEAYRLKASKKDNLKTVFPISEIQDFVKDLKKASIFLIYDQRKLKEEHAFNYFTQILKPLKNYFNVNVSIEYPIPYEIGVSVVKIESENPKEIIDIITDTPDFHFASQLCIFVYKDEKTIDKSLIIGLKGYYKYPKDKATFYSVKQIDKIPYRGKTTVESDEEKKSVKKMVFDYLTIDSVAECLLKDTDGSEIGFERLILPGKEGHIHWRRKLEKNLFEKVKLQSKNDLVKLVEEEDAFSFYPSLSKEIDWNEQKVKVRHKFVRELDPPEILTKGDGIKLVTKISDITKSLCEELEIPSIYMFSGSKSARVQCFIDYYDILNNLEKFDKDFPFIGAAYKEKPRKIEELYKSVYRSFNKAFDLELINKLDEKGLLLREFNRRPVPNVTFDSKSELRSLTILVDSPSAVSIGIGSPKVIKRINEKIVPLVCKPIEKCPSSEEEILQEFNIQSAISYFEKNSKKILNNLEKKITSKTFEKIFEKTAKNEKEFFDLCSLNEDEFFRKYF